MAKAIIDYLGERKPRPTPDLIFNDTDVPTGESETSDVLLLGKTQNSLEVVAVVEDEITLQDTDEMSIDLLYGSGYSNSVNLYSATASGETTIDAETELVRYVPTSDLPARTKLQMSTTTASATSTYSLLNELKDDLNSHMADDHITSAGETATYDLLDELKVDLNAHMSDGTAHTNADDVTAQVSADDATTKATAIALANDVRSSYEAHRVTLEDAAEAEVHGAVDDTNTVTLDELDTDATWREIFELANELRTDYEAHRVLTTDSVHDAADNTNSVTESAVGDVSAHTNDDDVTSQVSVADADSKAGAIALANAIRAAYEAHREVIEDSDTNEVHGAADDTNTVTLTALDADATWAEVAALADELRTDYEAHRVLVAASEHQNADDTNDVTATAVGTFATLVAGSVTAWPEFVAR